MSRLIKNQYLGFSQEVLHSTIPALNRAAESLADLAQTPFRSMQINYDAERYAQLQKQAQQAVAILKRSGITRLTPPPSRTPKR